MVFRWLKRLSPHGLYGRGALILLVPVVTLQLVVSIVFIQRHFDGVTQQMTDNLATGLIYVVGAVNEAPDADAARAAVMGLETPLDLAIKLPAGDGITPRRIWYDISGRAVVRTLGIRIPGLQAVDLGRTAKIIRLEIDTAHGPLEIAFERRRVSTSNPHQLLVLMVFAGVLMTLVSFMFLRNQLRPIKRLARAADAFGKGRMEPYRPSGATEVRQAGRAFLDMRARIERQMEQRTLMLSGVSHDLRTPLQRMKLELSMLDDGVDVSDLRRDVEEMERLIDTFLAFVRGESLEDPEETDAVALITDAVGRAQRAGRDVTLVSISGSGTAQIRVDAVGRALDNLIGNAVRYGTKAHVSAVLAERTVRYVVEDDGPGIPPEARQEALKPFTRLDKSRNQDKGSGVGLGLAIALDIARRHGGSLTLTASDKLGGLRADLVLAR